MDVLRFCSLPRQWSIQRRLHDKPACHLWPFSSASTDGMRDATPIVRRWNGPVLSDKVIRRLDADEGLQPDEWGNGVHNTDAVHEHGYETVLRVVRGSIRFDLPRRGALVALGPGDHPDSAGWPRARCRGRPTRRDVPGGASAGVVASRAGSPHER